jgi:hypothetical protein
MGGTLFPDRTLFPGRTLFPDQASIDPAALSSHARGESNSQQSMPMIAPRSSKINDAKNAFASHHP